MHPMYRVSDWVNDWEKKEQLVENITAYPTSSRVSSSNPAKRTHNIQEATSNKGRVTPTYKATSRTATLSPSTAFQKGRLHRAPPVDEEMSPANQLPHPVVMVSEPNGLPAQVEGVAKALENLVTSVLDNHHDHGDKGDSSDGDHSKAHSSEDHGNDQGDNTVADYSSDQGNSNYEYSDHSDQSSHLDNHSDQDDLNSTHSGQDHAGSHGDQTLNSHGATI